MTEEKEHRKILVRVPALLYADVAAYAEPRRMMMGEAARELIRQGLAAVSKEAANA